MGNGSHVRQGTECVFVFNAHRLRGWRRVDGCGIEINPRHPIVERLKDESDSSRFSDRAHTLFDQATLADGGQLDGPATFVKRLNELMLTLAGGPTSRIWTPGV